MDGKYSRHEPQRPRDAETFGHLWSRSGHSKGQSKGYWTPWPTKERTALRAMGETPFSNSHVFQQSPTVCLGGLNCGLICQTG